MARSKKKRGLFITFEGGEGVGKTSQIEHLRSRLEKEGHKVVLTREPGGTPGAEAVRHVLLSGSAEPLGPHMEALLFSAARSDHVESVIAPALDTGTTVLCDRFVDSTRVYQGALGHVEMAFLKELEEVVCENAWPDITLLLDIDPKEGMKRAENRRENSKKPDRFEKASLKEHQKRRNEFLKIARSEPQRVHVIDATGTEEAVAERIWQAVAPLFSSTKEPTT